ncbi:aspartate aminotransferase [Acrasis kona]|uniref:Aspartate aminotransferase n=1 Tax=Acrasis kona TaxID=1008807 RepID=A0AAW2YLH4_9EUKA
MNQSTAENRIKVLSQQIEPSNEERLHQLTINSTLGSKDKQMSGVFGEIEVAPRDPILGLNAAFKEDKSPKKVNLGVGAYRTEDGKPLVLPVVRKVEQKMLDLGFDKEYIPQSGLPEFQKVSPLLLFGKDSPAIKENRLACLQTLSGTGALRVGCEFVQKFLPKGTTVYVPNPTWGNHYSVIESAGLKAGKYRYLNKDTMKVDIDGLLEDVNNAPDHSVILLHVCAHNPTGVDPTKDDWKKIAEVIKKKNHLTFFDSAYQGFASGDLDKDAFSVRLFVDQGLELMAAQSYAKNFGLYGERIGAISFVCKDAKKAEAILSQVNRIIRAMYSSPPLHGARIVALTLGDDSLLSEWKKDLEGMANRIIEMRTALLEGLQKKKTPSPTKDGTWKHVVEQIGMFSFTGLDNAQVKRLIDEHHIYLTSDGRISMAGINPSNVEYIVNAIDEVVRHKY